MKKLKKIILFGGIFIIGLVIIGYLLLGVIVKTSVESILPSMTKTEVRLDKFELSLLSGEILIENLQIGNPEGFSDKNAFEVKTINVKFITKSMITNEIHINKVLVDGIKVNYEIGANGGTNFDVIQKNMGIGSEETAEEEVVTEEEKSEKVVLIDVLDITNSEVSTNLITLPLPDIHQEDIGKDKKSGIKETLQGIFSTILGGVNSVMGAGGDVLNGISKGTNSVKEGAEGVMNSIKNLF